MAIDAVHGVGGSVSKHAAEARPDDIAQDETGGPLAVDVDSSPEEQGERGSSDRHRSVSKLLVNLAKTGRAFVFYDIHNKSIYHFLTELLESFTETLKGGPVEVSVQPFEMWYEGEVVYINRDRELSLSFRLYRDGVRGMTFVPGFTWEELTRLLEVLSVRYTGVHQAEDDTVTLLWKAGFQHVELVAVEGFVPDDSVDDDNSGEESGRGLPNHTDMPAPYLPDQVPPEWVDVPEATLEKLRNQVSAQSLPEECLLLLWRLRDPLEDQHINWRFQDLSHIFSEVRNFLLSEEHLESLELFVDLLEEMVEQEPPEWDKGRRSSIQEILVGCGDEHAVRKLLHSIPLGERQLEPAMIRMLMRLCPNPIAATLTAIQLETGSGARSIARQILEQFADGQPEILIQRFEEVKGHASSDLVRVIARVGGDKVAGFIAAQVSHPDTSVQDEALRQLRSMTYSGTVGRALLDAYKLVDPQRRHHVLSIVEHSGDKRFIKYLLEYLEEAHRHMPPAEIEGLGCLLGKLGGSASVQQWMDWLSTGGWLRKSLKSTPYQQILASAALSTQKSDAAEATLIGAHKVANDDVSPFIERAIKRINGHLREEAV